MRRIIYAWDYVEWGGAQIHFLSLMKEARKKFEVTVVLPEGTDDYFLGFLDSEGIKYETFRSHIDNEARSSVISKIRRHLIRARAEYLMLRKIEQVGIDLAVHTDILPAQSLLSLVWLCLRSNVYITLHNALPSVGWLRWKLWKLKFGMISLFDTFHVFYTNKHASHYFSRLFSKNIIDDARITYENINPVEINNALEDPFDKSKTLERLGLPTDKTVVLAVGQFIDRKGRWTFLDAAKLVMSETDDTVFLWVAPQLPVGLDVERVQNFNLGDRFRLIKSIDVGQTRKDILKFFRVADVFVLPSFIEGIPIALLEAMALGIPCISTKVYGIPEAIINEKTGLLVEAGDPKALSEAVLRLVRDEALRNHLARQGRQLAITKFDARIAADTAVEAYTAAMDRT